MIKKQKNIKSRKAFKDQFMLLSFSALLISEIVKPTSSSTLNTETLKKLPTQTAIKDAYHIALQDDAFDESLVAAVTEAFNFELRSQGLSQTTMNDVRVALESIDSQSIQAVAQNAFDRADFSDLSESVIADSETEPTQAVVDDRASVSDNASSSDAAASNADPSAANTTGADDATGAAPAEQTSSNAGGIALALLAAGGLAAGVSSGGSSDDSGSSTSGGAAVGGGGGGPDPETAPTFDDTGIPTFFNPTNASSADGDDGFVVNGVDPNDKLLAVIDVGDINGDGFTDLLASSLKQITPESGVIYAGEAYIIYGDSDGFQNTIELSELNGSNGFTLANGIPLAFVGNNISKLGDVNGDDIDDFAIGAPGGVPGATIGAPLPAQPGKAYVVFGSEDGFGSSFDLESLDGDNGFIFSDPADIYGHLGTQVRSAGDLNNDGLNDTIVTNNGSIVPQSYVIFGNENFNALINPTELNGNNGFIIDTNLRTSTSDPVDLNDDGISDLVIGDRGAAVNGVNSGQTYVLFGKSDSSFDSNLTLSNLNGSDGFIINGIASGDLSGSNVDTGDINGDGIQDIIINAPQANSLGQTYVVYGQVLTGNSPFELSDLNGTNGFVVNDISADVVTIITTADINNDGFDDLLFGYQNDNITAVVYGGSSFEASFEISDIDGINGFVLEGDAADDLFGVITVGLTDINNDGIDDFSITALLADPNDVLNAGQVYVFYGKDEGGAISVTEGNIVVFDFNASDESDSEDGSLVYSISGVDAALFNIDSTTGVLSFNNPPNFDSPLDNGGNNIYDLDVTVTDSTALSDTISVQVKVNDDGIVSLSDEPVIISPTIALASPTSELDGDNGWTLSGNDPGGLAGTWVSGFGDANGDGIGDWIVTALGANNNAGGAAVFFGDPNDGDPTLNISEIDGTNGFLIEGLNPGDLLGLTASISGDFNGDNISDVLIGAYGANSYTGEAYLLFGNTSLGGTANLSGLNGTDGFVIKGANTADVTGLSVNYIGDFNGDDLDDIVIGAFGANGNTGAAYVVYGTTDGFGGELELSDLNGTNGFVINGESADNRFGSYVSSVGDFNDDGFDDLIVTADGNNSDTGAAYLLYGTDNGFGAAIDASDISGSLGFKITGAETGDNFGFSAGYIGDFNNDGWDDFAVGAINADVDNVGAGIVYAFYGTDADMGDEISVVNLDGSNGIAFNGALEGDQTGWVINYAGDPNGDGIDDWLVGAPSDESGIGAGYLLLGGGFEGFGEYNLDELNGVEGYIYEGANTGDQFGYALGGIGDVNQDGYDDLFFGAPQADNTGGEGYAYFGTNAAKLSVGSGTAFVADYDAVDDFDSENDGLVWSISGGIDADYFLIDPDSGELSFENAPDANNPQDFDFDNVYELEVAVTDSDNQADVIFALIDVDF